MSIRKSTIMIGIPGSGKSTYLSRLENTYVCSADHFWGNNPEEYIKNFDINRLGEAHKQCLRRYIEFIQNQPYIDIAVDNTNTRKEDISPYIAIASVYNLEIEIVYIPCSTEVGIARNIHNVPAKVIKNMQNNIQHMIKHWPNHWPTIKEMVS